MKTLATWFVIMCIVALGSVAHGNEDRVLTDMFGRTVKFKINPDRIITIDRGYLPQALKAIGEDERLVATGGVYPRSGPFNRNTTDTMFLVPKVLDIPNVGWAGYGSYDLEKIVEASPDLIIINQFAGQSDNPAQKEMIKRLEEDFNIPVFLMHAPSFSGAVTDLDNYTAPIRLLGEITESQKKAEKVIEKINSYIAKAATLRRDSNEKMLVLGLVNPEKGVGYVYGKDYGLASYTTSILGIHNVYNIPKNPIFSAEKILEFNPDVIVLVDGPGENELYDRFSNSPFMRSVNAIKNRRVHSVGQLSWWGDSKLMLPVQLMIYASAYYQSNDSLRKFYEDYIADIFGLPTGDMEQLMRTQKLNWLAKE